MVTVHSLGKRLWTVGWNRCEAGAERGTTCGRGELRSAESPAHPAL